MSTGVYQILNTATDKRYIGSAIRFRSRWSDHRHRLARGNHHSVALQRAWNKYGEAAFEFRPLLICSPANLLMYEQRCIDGLKPEYNICKTAGSSLGVTRSAETKARLAATSAGNKNAIGSKSRSGYKNSAAHNAAISVSHIGHTFNVGRVCSPETRAKISAANRGKVRSLAVCAEISARQKGVPKPPRRKPTPRSA